ncbi:MAG: DUF3488 domain-containing protein, partial [Candidatus Schekmanbacteria bacterium]
MRIDIQNKLKISLSLMGTSALYSLFLAEKESIFLFIFAATAIWTATFWRKTAEYIGEEGFLSKVFPYICLIFVCIDYFYISKKFALSLSHFLILYVIYLYFNRSEEKKIWQIYLASFLIVAVSASITDSFYFSIVFAVYLVSTIYSLILFRICSDGIKKTLKAFSFTQKEECNLETFPLNVKKNNFSFVVITALSVTLFFSVFFFIFLPRIGLGFMLSRLGTASAVAGFSEESRLGSIGEVLENRAVVMRIKTDKRISESEIRLRGIAYDLFRDNKWERSKMFNRYYKRSYFGKIEFANSKYLNDKSVIRQNISLSLSGSDAMFSLYRPVSLSNISGGYGGIIADNSLSLFTPWPHYYLINYDVVSKMDNLLPAKKLSDIEKHHYLDLQGINREIKKLASYIAEKGRNSYEKAILIRNYLLNNFQYTRKNELFDEDDPLYAFLFKTKKGHCEYFATALTIMCRAAGIPARYVNGFYGAEWNSYGKYYIVRQENAHAWTEIYLPEKGGWIYLDATPPINENTFKNIYSSINLFIDNLKMRWGEYVVGYDLNMQFKAAQKLNFKAFHWIGNIKKGIKENILRKVE